MAKTAKTTTKFATMGTSAAAVRNASGEPSKHTKRVPKTNQSKGGMIEAATATARKGVLERGGAKYAPQSVLYAPNAPEAAATERNVRYFPSAVGNRDFYNARKAASY